MIILLLLAILVAYTGLKYSEWKDKYPEIVR